MYKNLAEIMIEFQFIILTTSSASLQVRKQRILPHIRLGVCVFAFSYYVELFVLVGKPFTRIRYLKYCDNIAPSRRTGPLTERSLSPRRIVLHRNYRAACYHKRLQLIFTQYLNPRIFRYVEKHERLVRNLWAQF